MSFRTNARRFVVRSVLATAAFAGVARYAYRPRPSWDTEYYKNLVRVLVGALDSFSPNIDTFAEHAAWTQPNPFGTGGVLNEGWTGHGHCPNTYVLCLCTAIYAFQPSLLRALGQFL